LKSVDSFNQLALEVICCFDLNYQVYLKFDYVRIGSSPGWGAKQVNYLHGFRVSGFSLAPVLGQVLGKIDSFVSFMNGD